MWRRQHICRSQPYGSGAQCISNEEYCSEQQVQKESRKSPEVCELWVEEQDHKEASFFRLSEGRCRLNAVGFKLGKHMCGANGKKNRQYTKLKFHYYFFKSSKHN